MSLRRFLLAASPAARTGGALALLALVGAAVSTANPEAVVTERFAAALKSMPAQRTAATQPPISGSEAYWLAEKRRHEAEGAAIEPAAWSAPFAGNVTVGDRITIASGKAQRVLEVVAVSLVEPTPGTAEAARAEPAPRQIAVTCRDLTAPDGRLTTFLAPAGLSTAHGKAPRAL